MITGIADSLYPVESQAVAALLMLNCQFKPVPGQHISPIDAPDDVARALHSFQREKAVT